jgi:hypothetical protein
MLDNGEFDMKTEEVKFKKTFDLLSQAVGRDVFKKAGRGQQFLESYYETIAIGLYSNIDDYDIEDIPVIGEKVKNMENLGDEIRAANSESRIRKVVPFGKNYFAKSNE